MHVQYSAMAAAVALLGCNPDARGALPGAESGVPAGPAHDESLPPAPPRPAPPPAPAAPVRVETVKLASGRETFVLRGARGADRIAFLHGLCGHGMGYLQAFQFTAAAHGAAVAPSGDVACTGPWRSWSSDIVALERQIEDSFVAAGVPDPRGVTLIGYSLGASRAEALARRFPDRYDALVLIAAPTSPTPAKLAHLRAVAMMAGSMDQQEPMKAAARRFAAWGITARYFVLPGATHGAMGKEPETTFAEVLDWLQAQEPRPEK